MNSEQLFFETLRRNTDFLNSNHSKDNEANRHNLLIYPLITNPSGLAWDPIDLIPQQLIKVPEAIEDSHIFRGAIPKKRAPDLLILPHELIKNVAVIEEKKKHTDLNALINHKIQLTEYQALFDCAWGVLTDGERWIIRRNFETYIQFASIEELIKGMGDFRNCIGRVNAMQRYRDSGNFDSILIAPVPSNTLIELNKTVNIMEPIDPEKVKEMEKRIKGLGSNRAGVIRLADGQMANYGTIRVENGNFIFYTGQGLREIWSSSADPEKSKELKKLDENILINLGHIAVVPISEIAEIVN